MGKCKNCLRIHKQNPTTDVFHYLGNILHTYICTKSQADTKKKSQNNHWSSELRDKELWTNSLNSLTLICHVTIRSDDSGAVWPRLFDIKSDDWLLVCADLGGEAGVVLPRGLWYHVVLKMTDCWSALIWVVKLELSCYVVSGTT